MIRQCARCNGLGYVCLFCGDACTEDACRRCGFQPVSCTGGPARSPNLALPDSVFLPDRHFPTELTCDCCSATHVGALGVEFEMPSGWEFIPPIAIGKPQPARLQLGSPLHFCAECCQRLRELHAVAWDQLQSERAGLNATAAAAHG